MPGRAARDHLDHPQPDALPEPLRRRPAAAASVRRPRPSQARRTRPVDVSSEMICRVVVLIGTARPRPYPATAVLMPTTRPLRSRQRAAGVARDSAPRRSGSRRRSAACSRPSRAGIDRPSPLTTPAVTEPDSPIGLPTATTSWPIRSVSASPRSAAGAPAERARRTARSASGSAPMTSNAASVAVAERRLAARRSAPRRGRWSAGIRRTVKTTAGSGAARRAGRAPTARRPTGAAGRRPRSRPGCTRPEALHRLP